MRSAHVVAIVNKKGGVGKTVTALNFGAALREAGKKVLLVDLDSQCSLTICCDVDVEALDGRSLYDVLLRRDSPSIMEIIRPVKQLGFDLVPANIDLDNADEELTRQYMREFRLKVALQPILSDYDYILLDCPPHTGLLTINALALATSVLIPVQADYLAMRGTKQLLDTIERVQREVNNDLKIAGLLITMVDGRTTHSKSVTEIIRDSFGARVFQTAIPYTVKLKDSPTMGESVLSYEAKSSAAQAYRDLAKEFLGNGE